MDTIRALNAVTAGATTPAAALPQVQADAMAVISEIVNSERLSASERNALVAATVDIDQFITAQPTRAANLAQVAGLGMYLRQTSATTIPRWNVMTALRTYGLNINHEAAARPSNAEAAAAAVTQKLEAVARASRNVSLDTALAVAAATVASRPVAVQAAPVAKPAAPAPKAEAPAPAPRVETVV